MPASSTTRPVSAGKVGAARAAIARKAKSASAQQARRGSQGLIGRSELDLWGLLGLFADGEGLLHLCVGVEHGRRPAIGNRAQHGVVGLYGIDVVAPRHRN